MLKIDEKGREYYNFFLDAWKFNHLFVSCIHHFGGIG